MAVTFTLELPRAVEVPDFSRADLTFYGLDHSHVSYEARVFFDSPDAGPESSIDDPAYAGSFHIFGHGGCYGEDGHCAVRGPVTAFDRRLPHQLVPATRVLICTDPIKARIAAGQPSVAVTVVPIVRPGPLWNPEDDPDHVLNFDQAALHTYE